MLKDKDWSATKLVEEIDKGDTRTVLLNKRLPVWLLYWTTWVDADGVLQFRDDFYGRDQRLAVALNRAPRSVYMAAGTVTDIPKVVKCDGCRVP